MNRTAKLALTLALGTALFVPAVAQDNFPDVPENHWAYRELARMKQEGLLVGYPDGLFRGGRPASRYELAVAVHATWANLKGITDGLTGQIDELKRQLAGVPSAADLQNLRDSLAALQSQVNANRDDIAALRRLVDEFRSELTRLGADVNAMKQSLADLDRRVTDLEKRKLPFDVTGDVNLVALGGYSDDGEFGLTVDGRPTGFGRGDQFGDTVGATRDLTILHEGALTLTSNNDSGPKWRATFVMGNMMGDGISEVLPPSSAAPNAPGASGFGSQGSISPGTPFSEAEASWYLQRFNVTFDTSLAGLAFNAQVGRVGYKVSPMMFQRPDVTPYFANDRWDNGEYTFDGAILGFNFGSAKLNAFGGRTSARLTTNGTEINPLTAGTTTAPFTFGSRPVGFGGGSALPIDQMLGLHLSLPLTNTGSLNLAYLWLDSNSIEGTFASPAEAFNRVVVWGGDVAFNFGSLNVKAGYSKSDLHLNDEAVLDEDNSTWYAKVGFMQERWGIHAGYRSIDPLYGAPGDWGRIGIWWNPTDIEGFTVGGHFDLNEKLRLSANGEFYRGRDTDVSVLTEDDRITRFTVGLEYKMATNYNLLLGVENVSWDSDTFGGEPTERWYNIGFGFDLGNRTSLSFLWQISDYDADGVGSFSVNGSDRAKGGLITTQLSVRF